MIVHDFNPTRGRQRQAELCGLEANLAYMVKSYLKTHNNNNNNNKQANSALSSVN